MESLWQTHLLEQSSVARIRVQQIKFAVSFDECQGIVVIRVRLVQITKDNERHSLYHRWQGQGVGKALLRDAMQRTLQAADIAGVRAFAVHAKDDEARRFYEHFDFIPSPTDPMHLFVLLKDVRRIISESRSS
jgi:GNAT superfamily N-acetyltransferase